MQLSSQDVVSIKWNLVMKHPVLVMFRSPQQLPGGRSAPCSGGAGPSGAGRSQSWGAAPPTAPGGADAGRRAVGRGPPHRCHPWCR